MSPRLDALLHRLRLLFAPRRLHTLLPSRAWRLEATVSDMDEVPPHIGSRRAYLVATARRHKWLVFDCPCGTGHRIVLNLDRARRPVWTLRVSKRGVLTLHPSVDYRDDRLACHYVLMDGRVQWIERPELASSEVWHAMSDTEVRPTIGQGMPETDPLHAAASRRGARGLARVALLARHRRKALIRQIEATTGRTLLCYVSRGLIDRRDAYDLDRVVDEIEPGLPITLLLHTPGGDVDVAERVVDILRKASSPDLDDGSADLEVVIPDFSKSAGTLIALGASGIKMSDSSELGPIDPQFRHASGLPVSAAAVLRAYKTAEMAYANEPGNRALADAFAKFDPVLIAAMNQAMSRARTCAENLLKRHGGSYTAAPAALVDVNRFPSHGQMIDWRTAKEIGIPQVHYMDRRDLLWKRYRRLYHHLATAISTDVRVIESRRCTFIA